LRGAFPLERTNVTEYGNGEVLRDRFEVAMRRPCFPLRGCVSIRPSFIRRPVASTNRSRNAPK
jgi:hypothetical protein